ncbi:DNA repair protein RecO [Legionella taurinensis]|uniref:DNA repair protein RecO n=1 Tax=Legionella taurinensis TaxID=70611 RepID=A0A3A5LF39_9GAMM|nr:DNA repair protein RecO [Legionella taurinensis]MDX1836673.1 DNA repair protein RecO [Legionella taurinensis]PUT42872.1 DNA repair protein RecO [Legionella taurinensis]PUT45427.1 DNA repair protein RecO [Legionella taurinensis]PUT46998.1 DNA repair protein RecO [Legionella taurinensis]PUT49194.1 DNA repair protein RecO [Legionella taurinensis]
MTTNQHEAWLLHKRPAGDTSVHLSFFTPEQGLLRGLYRGGRAGKKQVLLQAFTPLWVAVDTRQDWHYINRLETLAPSLRLSGLSLFAGLYVNELLYYTLNAGESYTSLFESYQYTLQGLATVNNKLAIEALLRRFEMQLLDVCGYSLLLTCDVDGLAVDPLKQYGFVVGRGLVKSSPGFSGQSVLGLAHNQFDDLQVLKTAKFILRQAIDHLLGGRELKSRSLFPGMAKIKSSSLTGHASAAGEVKE